LVLSGALRFLTVARLYRSTGPRDGEHDRDSDTDMDTDTDTNTNADTYTNTVTLSGIAKTEFKLV
jgi:hypothetical protein